MFEYSRHVLEGCVVYDFAESLTMGKQSQELGATLNALNEVACLRVLFNCHKLKSIDSSGIGVLMIWKKLIENMGGVLAMTVPPESLVGRTFVSVCINKIIPIFPTREEAIAYLKNRHMDAPTLQKALLRMSGKNRAGDEDDLIREVRNLFHVFLEADNFLEKSMLEICAKTSSALVARTQINRLSAWLGGLPDQYEENKARVEGSVLIIGNECSAGFAQLAESLLAWLGLQAYNAAACDLSACDGISEAIKTIKPTHLALCMGCEKDWGKIVRAAKSLETMELLPKMICYAPVVTPGREPLSAKMTLCPEIGGMAALL
ncbi:MAG: STAS domain-containing protein [Candidatus Sumerlaeota bacterium]|nr:STAS domain-containing protein [Candidatus Sumerlaeota bacterium]